MKTRLLHLKNINCDFCADTIERAVNSLSGVIECQVNVDLKQAMVQYNPQLIMLATIQSALAKAGYEVELLTEHTNPLTS
ncbi:heavy-metal-associated domain-containing protein [Acaryochloris sp. CCMEE 5410]|uniref:heavy-metal-associated domain-containing protein n=1 Tax=Acaryochloris sp. CCMEE 5410 TaxID=310037 RepID=UPI001F43642C|nr:heavy-metal-associated domain-containing protein [Acaryochloris sp. CCMEE 5410]